MVSLIVFAGVLSVLILIHELGHFIFAKKAGVKVEIFSLGFGNKLFGLKIGDTEYRLSSVPLGGYVKMAGETPYDGEAKGAPYEFMSKPAGLRFLVLAAGPAFNYLLGFAIFAFIYIAGNPQVTTLVGGIMEDYPAKAAGVKEGDRIIEINGKPVNYWEDVLKIVHNTTSGSLIVKMSRDGEPLSFSITPKVAEFKNVFGQQARIGLLGVAPSYEIKYVRYNPVEAFFRAAEKTWALTRMTYLSLWRIATGGMSFRESVAGPIGIFVFTSKAAQAGIVYVLGLMASLSISLALFNILPIPVLDGGHILFLLIEKIKGGALSEKFYERISQAGMAFLITLTVFVIYNDAARAGWIERIVKVIARKV